jgi:hypothetical protein
MQTSKPLPYSSTWNLQIKVALNTVRSTDKGLRLHNGFIHWRYARNEIACGILYFLVALIDRWIELFCGGRLIGLSILGGTSPRVAVGLGLVYYLAGAVLLDIVAHPLYEAVKHVSLERIQSVRHLNEVAKREAVQRKRLYWTTLGRFACLNAWGLCFSTVFVWVYVEGAFAAIIYLAYTMSYSGLLWFQYNKVFAGDTAIRPLSIAFIIGFGLGLPLRIARPDLFWTNVLSLGITTWTAGYLTFRKAKLSAAQIPDSDERKEVITQKAIGRDTFMSEESLSAIFRDLEHANTPKVLVTKPHPFATRAVEILGRVTGTFCLETAERNPAFPDSVALLDRIRNIWELGQTVVYAVPLHYLCGPKIDTRAVSRKVGERLEIYVGLELDGTDWTSNFELNCYMYSTLYIFLVLTARIIEALVHETCEGFLGLSHSDAVLVEQLLQLEHGLAIPYRIRRQLETSSIEELNAIIDSREQALARHLCLQVNIDRDWGSLPQDIRAMLVKRVSNEGYQITDAISEWLYNHCGRQTQPEQYLARRDHHVHLSLLIHEYAVRLLRRPSQRSVATRRHAIDTSVSDIDKEVAPSRNRAGFTSWLRHPFFRTFRLFGTILKFTVLMLIAEPEFQRELAYLLKGNKLKHLIMFVSTRFCIYARLIQQTVLPWFMVWSLLV